MGKMLNVMRHRGPDDDGSYGNTGIYMGMVRLSIIDLQGGHQPMTNEDGTIWIVFNGEIFNYLELRKELVSKGHHFQTHSDTETIVHAYEEYGRELGHRLNGMFAIAIWDMRTRELTLIRDRFGVKPLFYSFTHGNLVFGSEIKTVLCHPDISREIDREALFHYLSLRNIPAPFTAYKGIRALLPGQLLIWDGRGGRLSKWYELRMNTVWKDDNVEEIVESIDEILRDSIKLRLRSDVEFGAYLSGGIDSSMVVAIMSEYVSAPVKTFTLAFADTPAHKRDSYFARKVAEIYATKHHESVMSWSDLQNELQVVLTHLDQPFAGVISSFWLSRFMRRTVRVALSGDGADDFFASYGHHRLVWPIEEVRTASLEGRPVKEAALGSFSGRSDFVSELAEYPAWKWRLAYAAFMDHEKEKLLTEQGKGYFACEPTSSFLQDIYMQCSEREDGLNRLLYLDINTLLPNEILYYNDMLSMAHSLEVRTPFLDYRLAELACSIPGSLKIRGTTLKYILRKVAARYLPQEIIDRPKEGFVLPKNTWLREGMMPLLLECLSKERMSAHGFFDVSYIDSLISRFLKGDDALTFKIWTLIVFQVWYENYVSM
jgi:asparagine synthase (glutamine-hydrolysing)